jgi:hypothetical protein
MRKKRRHTNPSSHHMQGKEASTPSLADHGHHGKKKGHVGTRIGVRPIKPAGGSVRHPALSRLMRKGIHKQFI